MMTPKEICLFNNGTTTDNKTFRFKTKQDFEEAMLNLSKITDNFTGVLFRLEIYLI